MKAERQPDSGSIVTREITLSSCFVLRKSQSNWVMSKKPPNLLPCMFQLQCLKCGVNDRYVAGLVMERFIRRGPYPNSVRAMSYFYSQALKIRSSLV